MSDIQSFISTVATAGGLTRPNRFSVLITLPAATGAVNNLPPGFQLQQAVAQQQANLGQPIQGLGIIPNYFSILGIQPNNLAARLNFMCCKAELPGKGFAASDVKTYGSKFQMPSVDEYSTIPLEFIVGRDMVERNFFDAWQYTVQDPSTSDFNYLQSYATTVDIGQMDEYDNITYAVRLFQAWPIFVGALEVAYENFNTYHKLQVTFTYRKWVNMLINSGTPSTIEAPNGGPSTTFESTILAKG